MTQPSSTWVTKLIYFVLSPILYCPKNFVPVISKIFTFLVPILARKEHRILQANIKRIFGLPSDRGFGKMFAKQVISHQIECAIETLQGIFRPHRVAVAGFSEFANTMRQQIESSSGQILITAHLGSWELLGMNCRLAQEKTFHVLAKPARTKFLTSVLTQIRHQMGTPVFWTDKKMIQKQMIATLKNGNWLGFVMDQKPQGRKGPEVIFCGQKTEFVAGPAAMACKMGSSLTAAFCVREGPFKYRLIAKPLLPPNHHEQDMQKVTQMCAFEIEQVIHHYPEQWCWNYKRWK